MREDDLHTDYYDLGRVFNGDWQTTVLAWLRDGPRRPKDLDAMADRWIIQDRWRQTARRLGHAQIHDALTALTAIDLVEKTQGQTHGLERHIEYRLTPAGEEYLVELDRLRQWLKRFPFVLDNALRVYHERHGA